MRCALAVAVLLLVPKNVPAQAGAPANPSASVVAENPPRGDALRRAKVWRPPAVPVASADLQRNPRGPEALPEDELVCSFRQRQPRGQTPKFWCALPSGEVLKVKVGAS